MRASVAERGRSAAGESPVAPVSPADPAPSRAAGALPDGVLAVRSRLLDRLLLLGALFGGPALAVGVLEAIGVGRPALVLLYLGCYLPLLICTALRRRLGYRVRAAVLLGSLYLLGLASLLEFGIAGAATLLFTMFSGLTMTFFGLRGGLLAILASLLCFVPVGALMVKGVLPGGIPDLQVSLNPASWLVAFSLLVLAAGTLVISGGVLQQALARAFERVTRREQEIAQAQAALRRENERRIEAEQEQARLWEQLLQAQKMEAVGQLAGGVAHDFNNLLQVILGNGAVLEQALAAAEEPEQRALDAILQASERARELTARLLTFSRRQFVSKAPVALGGVLRDVERLLRRTLGENIRLALSVREEATILGDAGQLEQALLNLAVNARDAMPDGGTLRIEADVVELEDGEAELRLLPRGGHYVRLTVSDTGSGIRAEALPHVFEPFFTTKEVGKGTGLGLVMVFGVVQQHGGVIDVASELGAGTTFTAFLPLIPHALAAQPCTAPPVAARPGGHETVLLVEDEPEVLELCRQMLEALGYTVLATTDPQQAEALLAGAPGKVDLLLSDLVMPERSGPALAAQLARGAPGLRVLFMSGYTDPAMIEAAGLRKGENLIAKPFTAAALARQVRTVLDAPEA